MESRDHFKNGADPKSLRSRALKLNSMKKHFLISILVMITTTIVVISCTSSNKPAGNKLTNSDKTYTDVEMGNMENLKKAYALFSSHDTAMFDYFADSIIEQGNPPTIGKKALKEFNKAFWVGFTDIRVDLDTNRIFAAGDYTFASAYVRGTNDGEFPPMGLSKTGKKIDVDFVEIIKWEGGKAILSIPLMNEQKMMQQLGMIK
jgi:hypothetical protein